MGRKVILKSLVCRVCGNQFTAPRTRGVCPECRIKERRQYQKSYFKKRYVRKLTPKQAEQSAEANAPSFEKTKPTTTIEADVQYTRLKSRRCKYCGMWISEGDFCKNCTHEKFSDVYVQFGITNGWDAKKRKQVPVKSGWRGRVCSGFLPGMKCV